MDNYQTFQLKNHLKRKKKNNNNNNKKCKLTFINIISILLFFLSSRPIQTGAPSIPYNGLLSLDTDLNVWQRRAAQTVQPKIEGNSALSHDPYLIHLWT